MHTRSCSTHTDSLASPHLVSVAQELECQLLWVRLQILRLWELGDKLLRIIHLQAPIECYEHSIASPNEYRLSVCQHNIWDGGSQWPRDTYSTCIRRLRTRGHRYKSRHRSNRSLTKSSYAGTSRRDSCRRGSSADFSLSSCVNMDAATSSSVGRYSTGG